MALVKVVMEIIIDTDAYTEGMVKADADKLVVAAELVENEWAGEIYSQTDDCRVMDAQFVTAAYYEAWRGARVTIGGHDFRHFAAVTAATDDYADPI